METANRALEALELRLGARWEAIGRARIKTEEILGSLRVALEGLDDPDCAVVVTGSLGRGEANDGSDADWILLVDGPSDPSHARLHREIEQKIGKIVTKEVGRTGMFGELVPSHDLVHYIAGSRDTNKNLTRRMLLLAESRALTNPLVRQRVADLYALTMAARWTAQRARDGAQAGKPPGPEGSIGKLVNAELNQDIYRWCMDLLGAEGILYHTYALDRDDEPDGDWRGPLQQRFLRSRANTIEGGTSEVMRNILGERVLGLPGDLRADAGMPWKEIPRG